MIKIKNNAPLNKKEFENKCINGLNKLSPPWVSTDHQYLPNCQQNEIFDEHFFFVEFNRVLDSGRINASPGLDGLDYEILQNLPTKFKLILLDIFNEMYAKGEYPSDWKHSFVHMIDKPRKNSVRPIAFTSCVCKVFEGLIKSRLQWWVEHENILPKNQAGFRKGKSCSDNLAYLTLQIDQALASKKEVLAAFLDVSEAFNNVLPDILINKLADIKCSEQLIKFVKFLTHERYIHTNIENNEIKKISKGVPQGGVLSPLLYLIYVANI